MFEVSAQSNVTIRRISIGASTALTMDVAIWYRLGGYGGNPPPTTGWVQAGIAPSLNFPTANTLVEIPVNIDLPLLATESVAFMVIRVSGSGSMRYYNWATGVGPYSDANLSVNVQGFGSGTTMTGNPPWTGSYNLDRSFHGTISYDLGGGQAPDMSVERNSTPIANGGNDALNDVSTLGETFTYEIHNTGTDDLNLTGNPIVDVVSGTGAPTVNVTLQPATTTIGFPGSTTFQVEVIPGTGPFDFTVSIDNDDPQKNPYTFTVSGTGVITNFPAVASLPAGSAFSVVVAGEEYAMALNPGQALSSAEITLTDPESDDVIVTGVTPPATLPSGISGPTATGPSHPLLLEWTGTADASNAPGSYTWLVDFEDVINGMSVRIEVTITINDLPPDHNIAAADGGDGSSGNPYTTGYNQGDDQTAMVDLAAVTDPNTSQNVTIAGITPGGGNPGGGTGFAFTLSGGMLTIMPDGAALTGADMGTHTFEVTVTDGANPPVSIHVEVVVIGATGAITFDTPSPLPSGRVDQPYSLALALSGATGTVTFSISSGALPAGLTMNAQGLISGTPTTPQQSSFTVSVIDSNPDTASATFELTINPKPIGGSGSSSSSGGCSSAFDGASWLALTMLMFVAGIAARRRRRVV